MKLSELNPDGYPPCFVNYGSYGPHTFLLHWTPTKPLALITKAVFRWQQEELLPFSTSLKIIKFLEGEYLTKRLDYLDGQD